MNAIESTSTRPYLVRALYEWCTDNGLTPYVAVAVDDSVQVPREYVKNGEIVLNVSYDATSALTLGNEFIEFKARFAGTAREIMVPMSRVVAIYARENGQGMAFPLGAAASDATQPETTPRTLLPATTTSPMLVPGPAPVPGAAATPGTATSRQGETPGVAAVPRRQLVPVADPAAKPASDDQKVVRLVPQDAAPDEADAAGLAGTDAPATSPDNTEPEPPRPPGGGSRPALKRVK